MQTLTLDELIKRFNRINPNRSIPTWFNSPTAPIYLYGFNRINPNRSIPTIVASFEVQNPKKHRFQSHQSKQINPDTKYLVWIYLLVSCFNRINPNRSIPTFKTYLWFSYRNWSFNRINPNRSIPTPDKVEIDRRALVFQSYQSKQINPDTLLQKTY